ncbi:MAG: COG4280 domain-containing protein [Trebonia sp.]
MNALPLILTVFVACVVEAVEALTIVLATGITREWRSTFQGMGVALVALALITAAIGPAIGALPLTPLRLVIGALLLIFGLQWLRKSVLRATGHKALHDEASAYLREVAAAESATRQSRRGVTDWYSFTLAFKGVLLEGLEVVFIVITFGDNQKNIGAAVIGAAAAIIVVTITGIVVKAPLTKVPENWMKFAVGVMLTSFGTFWGAEGAGVAWPGNDAALLVLVPVVALVGAACVFWLRSRTLAATLPRSAATQSEVIGS